MSDAPHTLTALMREHFDHQGPTTIQLMDAVTDAEHLAAETKAGRTNTTTLLTWATTVTDTTDRTVGNYPAHPHRGLQPLLYELANRMAAAAETIRTAPGGQDFQAATAAVNRLLRHTANTIHVKAYNATGATA